MKLKKIIEQHRLDCISITRGDKPSYAPRTTNAYPSLATAIKSHLLSIVPKEKKYEGMSDTASAIYDLKWNGYNQARQEMIERINDL